MPELLRDTKITEQKMRTINLTKEDKIQSLLI